MIKVLHFSGFNRISEVRLFTKEAGLHVSFVALKKNSFTLMVVCKDLILPEFVLITSILLTDLVGCDLDLCCIELICSGDLSDARIYKTENSDSLSDVMKSHCSSAVSSDSSSLIFIFFRELHTLAKCPFLPHDLQETFFGGHD